jgi:DNA-directed RNA polymerase specialized sigma24 family protein
MLVWPRSEKAAEANPMHDLKSTKELIEAWRVGSETAAEELVRRFARIVRDFVSIKTGPHIRGQVDQSQVAQDVMYAFLGWVKDKPTNPIQDTRHATNVLRVMSGRWVSKIFKRIKVSRSGAEGPVRSGTMVADEEAAALLDEVSFMLQQWDDRDAQIVWLSFDGYSSVEIAEKLDLCRHRVRRVLNRFGDWLKHRLGNYRS